MAGESSRTAMGFVVALAVIAVAYVLYLKFVQGKV